MNPLALRDQAYAPLVATLRANMRHFGALRIDHVLGLMRLFWIPEGKSPQDGAYMYYALDEILAVVRLESVRNRCQIGRAHVCTPVTNAHLVCRLLLEKKKKSTQRITNTY